MSELTGILGYQALTDGVGRTLVTQDLVRAEGPDSITFLHSQLSQDIVAMEVGAERLSFLLQPQGRFVAVLRVERVGDDAVHLWVDPGYGQAVRDALNRFKIRTKCELSVETVHRWAVRGALAERLGVWPTWPGFEVDEATEQPDVPIVSPAVFEAVRIERGVVRNGYEVLEKTLPAETGLVELAVNFKKGCYVGQELVERIDARGHVNRHLRGIDVAAIPDGVEAGALAGATLRSGAATVGHVTSAALRPDRAGVVALGYLRREIEIGSTVTLTVVADDVTSRQGEITGVVRAL